MSTVAFVVVLIAIPAVIAGAAMLRGSGPDLPPPSPDARWLADPTGRHEFRLWDGQRWTGSISDGGVSGWDPLPS